jgi:hypothetical protein
VNKVAAGRYSDIRLFTRKDVVGDLEVESFVEEAHRGTSEPRPKEAVFSTGILRY